MPIGIDQAAWAFVGRREIWLVVGQRGLLQKPECFPDQGLIKALKFIFKELGSERLTPCAFKALAICHPISC
jgi:hypothetical protein